MDAALAGLALGVAVAAGFGPISVLALTAGLRQGFAPAFGVGLGAAVADGLYALLAGLGLAALVPGDELQLAGGVALLVIAALMLRGGEVPERPAPPSLRAAFAVSLAATLANPTTIVSWAAAFTGVVPALDLSRLETLAVLPPSVALGTATWFTGVAAAAALAGRRLRPGALRAASTVAALVMAVFGVVLVVAGVRAIV